MSYDQLSCRSVIQSSCHRWLCYQMWGMGAGKEDAKHLLSPFTWFQFQLNSVCYRTKSGFPLLDCTAIWRTVFEDATMVQVHMDVNFVQFTFCNRRKKGNTVESDKINANATYSSNLFEFFSNNNLQESERYFI